jgi:hypothetical protein
VRSRDRQEAVFHQADPLRAGGHGAVVGDEHHRQLKFAPEVLQEADDLVPGLFDSQL